MTTALLVIDAQNEYFTGLRPVTYPTDSLENLLHAMDAAAAVRMPIILVQHAATAADAQTFRRGSHGWDLQPEVKKRSHDLLIQKTMPGSFTGTALEDWLRTQGIDKVVIAGYMTHMCCDTTARQACHLGFQVDFLADATGTLDVSNAAGSIAAADLHRAVLIVQHSRFSRVLTTAAWRAELTRV
jgi:nicotinamidase-related amidase